MSLRDTTSVRQSVGAALRGYERVVLAVSGGLDSMVLLDAAAAAIPRDRIIVATFDHGTGDAAVAAQGLVERTALRLGISCVAERATRRLDTEAELRGARWEFVRRVTAASGGVACTAHTADDQIETVLMRILRDAGARGLAALYAESEIVRPLLRLRRRDLARYASAQGLAWVEDPSNVSPRFLRNRVRHDLLPALRRVQPSVDETLLIVARKAARWRAEVEEYVAREVVVRVVENGRGVDVTASTLVDRDLASLLVLWPPIAARLGIPLDRRGVARLASFTRIGRVGSRIQLSGGWEVARSRDAFQIRLSRRGGDAQETLTRTNVVQLGGWLFRPSADDATADPWSAYLPVDQPLSVRPWRAGDAMTVRTGSPARKVKRFLTDAGVSGHERVGWPVVLAGDQIVWIPGVRRSDAATARSGRPGLAFVCEYLNR